MNNKQKHIAETYQAFKGGARNMVKLFEGLIQDYWGQDNRDLSNLEFLLNISKDTPRIQADISVLINRHTGCKVSKEAGKWSLTNEDLSKKKKAALEKGVASFVAAEWPTLQDARMGVPKAEKDKPPVDATKQFANKAKACFKEGIKLEQLLAILEQTAQEAAIEEDLEKMKEEREAGKVVNIDPKLVANG